MNRDRAGSVHAQWPLASPIRRWAAGAALALALALPGGPTGAVGLPLPDDEGPLMSYRAVVVSRSEIMAIDRTRRLLTLRERDEVFEVVADPRLRDFDDVRVGDLVEVQFTQALVLTLQPGTGIRERSTLSTRTDPLPPGQPPSGADLFEETIVIDVLQVDRSRQQLRVRDERGRVKTLTVLDDDVTQAARTGDQLVMRYRRATAIAVRPMPR
ncbi:MAG: hypothetical protein MUC74_06495 [Ideonella sp.]|jgi:hypothetical protein|nr:hypothetical protein [Ideonella sp.]